MKSVKALPQLQPRFRIRLGDDVAFGPGKADLLRGIAETGSIAVAAQRLEMSYMRAWTLVQTMNACFREPLVVTTRGGRERGGATLTATGAEVIARYDELLAVSAAAIQPVWQKFLPLLSARAQLPPAKRRTQT